MFWKLIDFCLGLLAARVETVDINRVWIEGNKVSKCRRWWGWVLILVGNPVLACRRVPVGVLFTIRWILWEREVKRAVSGESIELGRVLVCNQLPGVPLADWLIESGESKDVRLEALRIAVQGLKEFHRQRVDDGRANSIPLSHGDATLNNVLYDAESRSVHWIDFDLRHWLNVPAPQRQADDLRAFLFSAVRHFPDAEIAEFLSAMQQYYEDSSVWNCLRDQLASRWFHFDIFHRAQIRRGPIMRSSMKNTDPNWACLTKLIID